MADTNMKRGLGPYFLSALLNQWLKVVGLCITGSDLVYAGPCSEKNVGPLPNIMNTARLNSHDTHSDVG